CFFQNDPVKRPVYWFDGIQPYTASRWGTAITKCPAYKWFTDGGGLVAGGASLPFGSYSYNAHGSGESLQALAYGYAGPGEGLGSANAIFSGSRGVGECGVKAPWDMYAMGDANLFHAFISSKA